MGQQNDTEDTHGGINEVMVARQQLVVGSIPTRNFKKSSNYCLFSHCQVPVVSEYYRFPDLIVEQRLVFGLLQNLQSPH